MITFGITTHNEGRYIKDLLDQLVPHCRSSGDEIVVVDDYSTDAETNRILLDAEERGEVKLFYHELKKDFATHKNFVKEMAYGDYIFQIDADEILDPNLLANIKPTIYVNRDIDLFSVPRINIVEGMTDEDIQKYGWRVNDKKWIQFPDFQHRVYRRSPDIRWEGKVHERIVGHKTQATLPAEPAWALIHLKTIERQRIQNEFYNTI
jgi:glycosyltransferase involved in cell wall biosynthesis